MLPITIDLPESFLDEEVRCDYTISHEMKAVWAVELDLLAKLLFVCEKHNIKIMASGGTMLGAVRHNGFIPWDDDIDMMMSRNNYERLCEVAEFEFKDPYFFQTEKSDPGSLRGHAQLRNSNTTGALQWEFENKRNINQGIFIDIFPFDVIPDNIKERKKFINELGKMKRKISRNYSITVGYCKANKWYKRLPKIIAHKLSKPTYHEAYFKFEKQCQKYNSTANHTISLVSFQPENTRCYYDRDDFSHVQLMNFEFLHIPVPVNFDAMLKKSYGEYHQFVKGTSLHGGVIFDCSKSYLEYLRSDKKC